MGRYLDLARRTSTAATPRRELAKRQFADLRIGINRSHDWQDLYEILGDAQEGFVVGTVSADEVDELAEMARSGSRSLPEHRS